MHVIRMCLKITRMIFIQYYQHYINRSFSINYNIASDIKQDKRLVEYHTYKEKIMSNRKWDKKEEELDIKC